MKHIVFCLPGAPTLHSIESWDALRTAFAQRPDLKMTIVRGYKSSVVHCRNELLEVGVKGLKKDAKPFGGLDYDFMMWIDADSVYTPQDFFNLLDLDMDIATGLVPIDTEGKGAVGLFNDFRGSKYLNLKSVPRTDPVMPVDFCGFAFLLVKQGVFESLDYPWFDLGHFFVDDKVIHPGEDFRWCMSVKEKGYQIHAHPGVRIGHEKRVILETPGPPTNLLEKFLDQYDPAWRLSMPVIETIQEIMEQRQPRKILEIGPGASSLAILPWCLEHDCQYWALDHEGPYAAKHIAVLKEAELPTDTTFAVPLDENGWYAEAPTAVDEAAPYDLVIVDGPLIGRDTPDALAAYERWGDNNTVWVFDDVNREPEKRAAIYVARLMGLKTHSVIQNPNYPRKTWVLVPSKDRSDKESKKASGPLAVGA